MIHSLSGGVIADNSPMLFAKVDMSGAPRWYLAPFPVQAGDKVLAPFGNDAAVGTVIRVEQCTRQTAPVPVNRIKALEKRLENG